MAEQTKNLDLTKPAQSDFYNVDIFNNNFQKIDDFAEEVLEKTTYLERKDVLTIETDGWYYVANAENIPSATTYGYVRVMCRNAEHRLVYWHPHDSTTEYINVLTGGKWLGWTEVFTNKGGTLKGALKIFSDVTPIIDLGNDAVMARIIKNISSSTAFDDGLLLTDYSGQIDGNEKLLLRICHKFAKTDLNKAVQMAFTKSGKSTIYNMFGEHNKPTVTYTGTGHQSSQTVAVAVGGMGSVVLIYGAYHLGLVWNEGGLVWSVPQTSSSNFSVSSYAYGSDAMKFDSGVLTLKGKENLPVFLNYSGYIYNCYVL